MLLAQRKRRCSSAPFLSKGTVTGSLVQNTVISQEGKLFCGKHTLVMGIINATPDSFSDGGVNFRHDDAIATAFRMLEEGADILDIGGESSRPGSDYVGEREELDRVIPVVKAVMRERPDCVISLDTRRRIVAESGVKEGARIINDISGFRDDPSMVDFGRETESGMIIMHMHGTPRNMQTNIHYDNFPKDIFDFFTERIQALENKGIDPDKIVIDPGIGFGKNFDQNLTLLNRIDYFNGLKKPILIGASRKAFLGKILGESDPKKRDAGTLATVAVSVMKGASIVRVHDVLHAVQVCRVTEAILQESIQP